MELCLNLLTLSLVELRLPHQSPDASQRSVVTAPLSSPDASQRSVVTNRDDDGSEENRYVHSDGGAEYSCDTDSDNDLDDRERGGDLGGSTVRKSFSYGSLQSVNYAGGLFYAHARIDGEDEDWIYYSHRKSDASYHVEQEPSSTAEEHTSIAVWRKKSILRSVRWRKEKPPKKGEPLLKNKNGEEGGDDIDYDRRLLTSSDEYFSEGSNGSVNSMVSVFGDDNFVVGNWESKEVLSRDGHLKLSTQVFFASIDQRSERAAGGCANTCSRGCIVRHGCQRPCLP